MKLLTLELLDAGTDIAPWLEQQLTSDDLAAVVAELLSWNVASNDVTSLEEALGNRLPQILESGLSESDGAALLKNPRLLIDLQEQICFQGGPYWQNRGVKSDSGQLPGTSERVTRTFDNILKVINQATLPESETSVSNSRLTKKLPNSYIENQETHQETVAKGQPSSKLAEDAKRRSRMTTQSILGLAFVLLIGLGIILSNQKFAMVRNGSVENVAVSDWGLNNLQKFQQIETGPAYLNSVATAMNDWIEKPPADSATGKKRIEELIKGCQNLIADDQMNRSPLDEENRKWLHGKCAAWIEKFEEDLVALNQNPDSWPDVLTRMNAKIEKAVNVIHAQAEKLAAPTAA